MSERFYFPAGDVPLDDQAAALGIPPPAEGATVAELSAQGFVFGDHMNPAAVLVHDDESPTGRRFDGWRWACPWPRRLAWIVHSHPRAACTRTRKGPGQLSRADRNRYRRALHAYHVALNGETTRGDRSVRSDEWTVIRVVGL